jgi:predicted negative regulator of RcsB-dependent stress response
LAIYPTSSKKLKPQISRLYGEYFSMNETTQNADNQEENQQESQSSSFQTLGWWIMSIFVIALLGFIAWQIWKAEQYNQAQDYSRMGERFRDEGDWQQAQEMYFKSLALFTKLENQEEIAKQYGQLALLHAKQGDLNQAEKMYLKSVENSPSFR